MSVSEKKRAKAHKLATERSRRNQAGLRKKSPSQLRRQARRAEARENGLSAPVSVPPKLRGRIPSAPGEGTKRAKEREAAFEAKQQKTYPHILTSAQKRKAKADQDALAQLGEENLSKNTVPELRTIAQNLGIKGVSKLTKPVLIEAIKLALKAKVDEARK